MTILKRKYQANKKIKIKKIIKTSLIDWEGMIVSTLYVGGCNFHCPFCYNTELVESPQDLATISKKDLLLLLEKQKPFLDGICLSGGEPTLYEDLPEFLKTIKDRQLKIKLDTNGSYPEMLEDLLKEDLVDYIAMDIKNCLCPDEYQKAIGVNCKNIIEKIKKSLQLIMNAGIEYEFRTTVIPELHNSNTIVDIAREIKGAQRFVLQKFIQSEDMLDQSLKNIKPYSEEKMQEMGKKIESYVEKSTIR